MQFVDQSGNEIEAPSVREAQARAVALLPVAERQLYEKGQREALFVRDQENKRHFIAKMPIGQFGIQTS